MSHIIAIIINTGLAAYLVGRLVCLLDKTWKTPGLIAIYIFALCVNIGSVVINVMALAGGGT